MSNYDEERLRKENQKLSNLLKEQQKTHEKELLKLQRESEENARIARMSDSEKSSYYRKKREDEHRAAVYAAAAKAMAEQLRLKELAERRKKFPKRRNICLILIGIGVIFAAVGFSVPFAFPNDADPTNLVGLLMFLIILGYAGAVIVFVSLIVLYFLWVKTKK